MTSRITCLLLLLAVSGVLAKPTDSVPPSPALDITVSYPLGRPLFGDQLGPFPPGIDLTLICSSSEDALTLAWWEGDTKLESKDDIVVEQNSGSSIALEALSVSDDGRQFTCKAEEVAVAKTVVIQVEKSVSIKTEETLDIKVNGRSLEQNENIVEVMSGVDLRLTCVVQGYDASSPSWFEDDTRIESQSPTSLYAASSGLTLRGLTKDTSRRLSCRSDGSAKERTVDLLVFEMESYETVNPYLKSVQIVFIITCVLGVLVIIVLLIILVRLAKQYKEAVRSNQVSKVSDLFKKYSLLPSVNVSSKDDFSPQLTRGPYKPCTVLIDPEGSE